MFAVPARHFRCTVANLHWEVKIAATPVHLTSGEWTTIREGLIALGPIGRFLYDLQEGSIVWFPPSSSGSSYKLCWFQTLLVSLYKLYLELFSITLLTFTFTLQYNMDIESKSKIQLPQYKAGVALSRFLTRVETTVSSYKHGKNFECNPEGG